MSGTYVETSFSMSACFASITLICPTFAPNQIQKNTAMIEGVMHNVRSARLVSVDDFADRRQKFRIDTLFEVLLWSIAANANSFSH